MSGPAGVLTLLDRLHGEVFAAKGHIEASPIWEARAAVAELIDADKEYDTAITALSDLNRRVAEHGWIEIEHDALRKAGERVVRAQSRRQDALVNAGGAK